MKNIRIVHGTLMYPLEVGSRALIFEEGRYLHTSTVIAIHGVTPQQIRFETMNSHYKRYDADVFTGVSRGTAAVFQFHSAALRRLNKVGCQRYEGDYTRLKQKHAERRARRMAG